MKQVELLGEQGNVDESMKLMAQVRNVFVVLSCACKHVHISSCFCFCTQVEELKRQKVQADKQQRMNDESAPNGKFLLYVV